MDKLHPGAKWYFRVGGYTLFAFFGLFFGIWMFVIFYRILHITLGFFGSAFFEMVIFFILIYIIFAIVITEIYARMAYNRWFYEFTEDGLKLERGVIFKKYSQIPYERIQNVDIHRGIIARMFGFSSIAIQTAGYSAQSYAEGYIPAVEMNQAEQIRNFVMKKITSMRK